MKTLYLFRHAKSSWEDSRLADEERPLTPKGITKTLRVSGFLKDRGIQPGLIISSHAVRAFETAVLVAASLGYPKENIKVDRKIYDGYHDRILDVIYSTPDDIGSLMIFGHNPTITQIANLFLDPGIEAMDPSAVVGISFDTDRWDLIPDCAAKMEFFVYPKLLKRS
jgi:phosphohistidine phosphatase